MERFAKKWVSIALLSVVVPVGLLVSFRLTGILQEPLAPEVVAAETVKWSITRPTQRDDTISSEVLNLYHDGTAFVELNVDIYGYKENSDAWPFEGNDGLHIGLTAATSLGSGFIHSVVIKFCCSDKNALIAIHTHANAVRLYNVELEEIVDMKPTSFVTVSGVNRPNECGLEIFPMWVFYDQNCMDHQMIVTLEATYFNGTAYREAVVPIQLEVTLS